MRKSEGKVPHMIVRWYDSKVPHMIVRSRTCFLPSDSELELNADVHQGMTAVSFFCRSTVGIRIKKRSNNVKLIHFH